MEPAIKIKEFRYILFETTGGHEWEPIPSDWKYTDHKGQEYIAEKCTKCGLTAQRYVAVTGDKKGRGDGFIDALYISPAYLREHVIKCPEEMGLFDYVNPEKEETVAVLGGGECKPIKIKRKKKKKGKKDKKKKDGWKTISQITRLKKPKKQKKFKITRRKKS